MTRQLAALLAIAATALLLGCGSSSTRQAKQQQPCMYTEAGVHLCGASAVTYYQQMGVIQTNGCEPVWLAHAKRGTAREQAEASAVEAVNQQTRQPQP
jgi:uncharacterized protein YceK